MEGETLVQNYASWTPGSHSIFRNHLYTSAMNNHLTMRFRVEVEWN